MSWTIGIALGGVENTGVADVLNGRLSMSDGRSDVVINVSWPYLSEETLQSSREAVIVQAISCLDSAREHLSSGSARELEEQERATPAGPGIH
jgi:hypothetical protein